MLLDRSGKRLFYRLSETVLNQGDDNYVFVEVSGVSFTARAGSETIKE